MQISLLNNICFKNIVANKQNIPHSKSIDISHNLKSDTVSFSGGTDNNLKSEELELCNRLIKQLYGEKAVLTSPLSPSDNNFQKFLVTIKGEYKEPATVVLIKDEADKLQNITIQEHKNNLWEIGAIKVYDNKGELVKQLSPQQAKIIRYYRGNMATNINHALRFSDNLSLWQKEIDNMDSLFNDSKIYSTFDKDTVLYRGFEVNDSNRDDFAENWDLGKIIQEKGFLSTTTDKDRVENYGNFYLKITVPKGTKYLDMPVLTSPSEYYIHESEVLLNRNSKLKLTGYDEDTRTFSATLVNE